jgi:hypothetical protein
LAELSDDRRLGGHLSRSGGLAERYRLRGYDSVHLASYLEVGRRAGISGTQFSSFEQHLNRAARAAMKAMAETGRR